MVADDGAIWLAGCGNMGGAMLARWLACGLDPARVTVIRPSGRAVADGVRVMTAPPEGEPPPALLMLGMKPQKLDEAAPLLADAAGPKTVLLSILAGVERAALAQRFPRVGMVVRAMPNTPVAIGKGVVTLVGGSGDAPEARAGIDALMAPLGLVEWLADERAMDAATALAGSGPAFLFRFVDALARAGAADGLDASAAARLALATVEGAATLAAGVDETPAALADRVASPGGSTRAGLDVLDGGDALDVLLAATLAAARRRNAEMAAAAR
jgi:pyrroline-5-carboxylate reductase